MIVKKSTGLKGEMFVPGDKSISHRSIIVGAISDGITNIEGFLMGEDCLSTIECFKKMGIEICILEDNKIKIKGKGLRGLKKPDSILYAGNSGTTTRLLAGLLSAAEFDTKIDGDASIRKRPMDRIIKPLLLMGADIKGVSGNYCPLSIYGKKLSGIEYTLPVSSAQLKSALILAGIYASSPTIIKQPQISRDHTEIMLESQGSKIIKEENKITVYPAEKLYARDIKVPGDISSAAYFIVAGLIVPNSEILIKNVGINPTRTGIIDVLLEMGGNITIHNKRIWQGEEVADILVKSSDLKGTIIKGEIIPRLIDEIPIIAIAAAVAHGETKICDAQELKVKESNRIDAMVCLLKQAGCDIEATEDGMIINGENEILGGRFDSYNDHRIAMSMAVMGLVAKNDVVINNDSCIAISFPGFENKLKSLL